METRMQNWVLGILALLVAGFIANCSGDDDDDTNSETGTDAGTQDTGFGDTTKYNKGDEETALKKVNDTIAEGKAIKSGIYHIKAMAYAVSEVVDKTLGGPMEFNLWVNFVFDDKGAPSLDVKTDDVMAECVISTGDCTLDARICIIEIPDEPGSDLDNTEKVGSDGAFEATLTNIVIPGDFNEHLEADTVGTIHMKARWTDTDYLMAWVDMVLTDVKIGGLQLNQVELRNYDVDKFPYADKPRFNYEDTPAVGWYERKYLGKDALANPYDLKNYDPETNTTEPMCLTDEKPPRDVTNTEE